MRHRSLHVMNHTLFCSTPRIPNAFVCCSSFCHPNEQCNEQMECFYLRHRRGLPVSFDGISELLKVYTDKKDVAACRKIHSLALNIDLSSLVLYGRLMDAFAFCGRLLEASLVFAGPHEPSNCTWHAIILAHISFGAYDMAFILYYQMLREGFAPSRASFFCMLKACTITLDLKQGESIHNQVIVTGIELDVVSETKVVDFYAKCGALDEAQNVFDRMSGKNLVSWGALLAGYVHYGYDHHALKLYESMRANIISPDENILSSSLKACGRSGSIRHGQLIHDTAIRNSFESNTVLGNSLIGMYVKCGSLFDARKVFDDLSNRNSVSWASIFSGYATDTNGSIAFDLYMKMELEGIKPTTFIVSSVLKTCGKLCSPYHGMLLHDHVIKHKLEEDMFVNNGLIDMYMKCRYFWESRKLFNLSAELDEVSWSSLISGYVQDDKVLTALHLFETMQGVGQKSNTFTFSCILQACGTIGGLKEGMLIHHQIIIQGDESDTIVGSSLIDMYCKCGTIPEGIRVFDGLHVKSLASWGAVIDGCAATETHSRLALELFERIKGECVRPNIILYSSALRACLNVGTFKQCHALHDEIIRSGLEIDMVAGNILVNIYIKSGNVDGAHKVFDGMSKRDVVSWNSLIYGYAEQSQDTYVVELYSNMNKSGMNPDRITFLCVLKACGGLESLERGRLLHISITMTDVALELSIENALIDMYSRCGSIDDAKQVFANMHNMQAADVVSWGTIIAGHVQHGDYDMVEHSWKIMGQQGMMPDVGIFTSTLAACSQTGRVQEAHRYFLTMRENHSVILNAENYYVMTDLIARMGHLNDAKQFLESMPKQADIIGWTSLLTACIVYGDNDLAQTCFEQAIKLKPNVQLDTF